MKILFKCYNRFLFYYFFSSIFSRLTNQRDFSSLAIKTKDKYKTDTTQRQYRSRNSTQQSTPAIYCVKLHFMSAHLSLLCSIR